MRCGLMILHMSGLRVGSDGESEARRGQGLSPDSRKPEVLRTARLNAEDAEFGQEDTEELSAALTTYRRQRSRKSVGRDEPRPAMGSSKGAVEVQGVWAGSANALEQD